MPSVAVLIACGLAVLLIGGSSAQRTPCCGPKQFEGLFTVLLSPNSTFHEVFSTLSYDFTRQMVASNETLVGSRGVLSQRVLVNGASRTMYIVDHHSRECRIIALSKGLDPPCVPSHFRYEGAFHFGAGTTSLSFNSFRGRVGDLEASVATVGQSCIPMSQVVFNHRFQEIESFVNLTLGIRNPAVFAVPPECHRAGVHVESGRTPRQLGAAFPFLKSLFLGNFGY